jgi:hypothetical protein
MVRHFQDQLNLRENQLSGRLQIVREIMVRPDRILSKDRLTALELDLIIFVLF